MSASPFRASAARRNGQPTRVVAGDLKLGYAQFEELETFARFGRPPGSRHPQDHRAWTANPRLPQAAGIRAGVRACTTRRPAGVTAELFDPVPLDQMTDAEHAVHEAAANIPTEACARFETADKLSDEDRKTIIEIARKALARSSLSRKPNPKPKTGQRPNLRPRRNTNLQPRPSPNSRPNPSLTAGPNRTPQRTPNRSPSRRPNQSPRRHSRRSQ